MPTSPAFHEVPQATMWQRLTLRRSASSTPPSFAVPSERTIRPRKRVADGLGLLGDLLQHEVREAAALDVGEAEGDLLDAAC